MRACRLKDNNEALLKSLEQSVHHDAIAALEKQGTVQLQAMREERDEAIQQSNMLAEEINRGPRNGLDMSPAPLGWFSQWT